MELMSFTGIVEHIYRLCNVPDVNMFNSIVKLVLSALLGSVIGYERKSKGQIAGVGTFALISSGATLAMILSIYIPQEYLGLKNGDPGRIAAQVITGIGFLGAGTIIRMKGTIKGLTTAAGIWLIAMIGMTVGAGLYLVGIVATALMLLVLVGVTDYEHRVNISWRNKVVKIDFSHIDYLDLEGAKAVLLSHKIRIADVFITQDFAAKTASVSFVVLVRSNADILCVFRDFRNMAGIKSVTFDSDFKI